MPTETETISLRREQFAFAEKTGGVHLKRLAPELKALDLPKGSHVIVNVVTGDYVTGTTRGNTMRTFQEQHPKCIGWIKRIDRIDQGGE